MTYLLAIDVGNTNTVLGVFHGHDLVADWRIETNESRTSDEYAVLLHTLASMGGMGKRDRLDPALIDHGIIASVVPPAVPALLRFFERYLEVPVLIVGPGIKTSMPILYEDPRDVGADRIVNAVAAYDRFGEACIVVDFGTATTWDVVTPRGEYFGGVIAPGISISAEALYQHASKLPRVGIERPGKVIGKNTVAAMQSGLVYGYASMVDGIVDRIQNETRWQSHCIATGGLAPLIAAESRCIEVSDEMLTLRGLAILFQRNL